MHRHIVSFYDSFESLLALPASYISAATRRPVRAELVEARIISSSPTLQNLRRVSTRGHMIPSISFLVIPDTDRESHLLPFRAYARNLSVAFAF